MSRNNYVLVLVIFFLCISCGQVSLDYRYADKPDFFECELDNARLFKEAIYSFEDDLVNYYTSSDTLEKAYEVLVNSSNGNTINRVQFVSSHTIAVFRELRKIDGLWISRESGHLEFDYNHPVFDCIENAIFNKDFKDTFKMLRDNDSLEPRITISFIRDNQIGKTAATDKALALYISLDYCFHQMNHMFIPKEKY